MKLRIGLPKSNLGRLFDACPTSQILISMGAMYEPRRNGFIPPGMAPWHASASLDSAGFTAMLKGGYRWSIPEYVEYVCTNGGLGHLPFPWAWWSAMDYCCEQEIASSPEEVQRRIDKTIQSYGETLDALDSWRAEGVNDVCDPLPILQGRNVADYLACFRGLEAEWTKRRSDSELPFPGESTSYWSTKSLMGLGSVCRRHLRGDDGLLTVLEGLHRELPPHVKLHLFGVKGTALPFLSEFGDRVYSVDSQAWGIAARNRALREGVPCTVEVKGQEMQKWYSAQMKYLAVDS